MNWSKEVTSKRWSPARGEGRGTRSVSVLLRNGEGYVIEAREKTEGDGKDSCVITVTGAGISDEMVEHLADSLAQAIDHKSPPPALRRKFDIPVAELNLSVRAANCLEGAGIHFVGQLVTKAEPSILRIKNMGRRTLKELSERLAERELSFGMQVGDWTPPKSPAT